MLGILAYNHNAAFSFDYLAFLADLLYGWFNLHCIIPYLSLRILLLLVAGLFCAPGYAALSKVIYRHFYGYLVTRQYSYIIHSELARNVSCYYMLVGKLYFEGRVGQCLNYCTLKFYNVILWQNNPSSAVYL